MKAGDGTVGRVSWERTVAEVKALLPSYTHCTPASLMYAAEKVGVKMVVMPEQEFPMDERDPRILRTMLASASPDEQVIVVTDCSFRKGWSPFLFRLSKVEEFTANYRALTNECVTTGLDVVLICLDSKFLVVHYHEGKIASIRPETCRE